MPRKRKVHIRANFRRLLEKVREISPEAADWLEAEAKTNPSDITQTTELIAAFYWEGTPQGHRFWSKINRQIAKAFPATRTCAVCRDDKAEWQFEQSRFITCLDCMTKRRSAAGIARRQRERARVAATMERTRKARSAKKLASDN